jgi:transposase-like protein
MVVICKVLIKVSMRDKVILL